MRAQKMFWSSRPAFFSLDSISMDNIHGGAVQKNLPGLLDVEVGCETLGLRKDILPGL